MEQYEIVIDCLDDDRFKEGIHDIRVQLVHIQSHIIELEKNRDILIDAREDAINNYCDPDNELWCTSVWIPKRIAKVD